MVGKVLIVEDEIFNRILLKEILQDINNDLIIYEASSIKSATNFLSDDLNIIFLDLNLEEMDGTLIIDIIREKYNQCRIVITSGTDKRYELKGKYDWYLLKPYSDETIKYIVENVFLGEG